jgi:hypothetical protein
VTPTRYKQSVRAPQGLDGVQENVLKSQEDWKDWPFAGPVSGSSISDQKPHSFSVPAFARRHFFWIAAGAFRQENTADDWYVQVNLNFFRSGRPVGSFIFGDASPAAAAVFLNPKRQIMRTRADATGSAQPVLRMQVTSNATWVRDNLDVACFDLSGQFDRVDFEILDSAVNVGATRIVFIRTGCRIVSFI